MPLSATVAALLLASASVEALHPYNSSSFVVDSECQTPGTCTPPDLKYSKVIDTAPRLQWGDSGGYCGSASVQTIALSLGTWVSQDLVRKAAGPGGGHGNDADGYEILHTNIQGALDNLGFEHDDFDNINTPVPQSGAYLAWLKQKLVQGQGIVWFIMCKGDSHNCYNIPNATYDHIEPVFGIYSDAPLTLDAPVYDDDVLVHGSNYAPDGEENYGYFRPFSSLVDTTAMNGNCADAVAGYGHNEMYPCVELNHNFGYALTGVGGPTLPVSLDIGRMDEPDVVKTFPSRPADLTGTVTISELTAGSSYTLYRFDVSNAEIPNEVSGYEAVSSSATSFTADGKTYTYVDPQTFKSDGTVSYRCVAN